MRKLEKYLAKVKAFSKGLILNEKVPQGEDPVAGGFHLMYRGIFSMMFVVYWVTTLAIQGSIR